MKEFLIAGATDMNRNHLLQMDHKSVLSCSKESRRSSAACPIGHIGKRFFKHGVNGNAKKRDASSFGSVVILLKESCRWRKKSAIGAMLQDGAISS